MRLARSVFFALVAVLVIQGIASFSRVPETMASHFDLAGAPNGYQSKPVFLLFFVGLIVLAALFAYGIPALIAARPQWTNLPHKERWLAPDHRADSLAFLSTHFTWLACAMLVLGNALFVVLVRVNSGSPRTLPSGLFLALVGGFVVFTAWWLLRLYHRLAA